MYVCMCTCTCMATRVHVCGEAHAGSICAVAARGLWALALARRIPTLGGALAWGRSLPLSTSKPHPTRHDFLALAGW